MKNKFKFLGIAVVIAAIVFGMVLLFSGCKETENDDNKLSGGSVFKSVDDFTTWLDKQPANTAATAYKVKINTNWLNNSFSLYFTFDKYYYLDFSDSKFTSFGDDYLTSLFRECTTLTGITLPNNVTSIGYVSFAGCTSLSEIIIPDSVTSIEGSDIMNLGAFTGCTSLTKVTIGTSVKNIGSNVFKGCTSLTNINIPDSVTTIGSNVFSGCTSLVNINIPNSVTAIEGGAFFDCTALTNVTIGNNVFYIGEQAFKNCTSLTGITIPISVTEIAAGAFEGTGLTSVTIPSGVTKIEGWAFNNCTSLTSVTFQGTITSDNFSDTYTFPGDLRDKYLAEDGGIGTYTTTVPVDWTSTWTKQE